MNNISLQSVLPSMIVTRHELIDGCMLTGNDPLMEREIVSAFSTAPSSSITKVQQLFELVLSEAPELNTISARVSGV